MESVKIRIEMDILVENIPDDFEKGKIIKDPIRSIKYYGDVLAKHIELTMPEPITVKLIRTLSARPF
jgi:hypothetical protein